MIARLRALFRTSAFWWGLVAVWFVTLFFLSALPKPPPGPKLPFEDKFMHLAYYSIGGAWCYLARRFSHTAISGRRALLAAVLFCAGVGAFDEFHQSFVPGRSGNDPWDWLADTLGGLTGSLAGWLWYRRTRTATTLA